jgi:hypothetical protein
MISPHVSHRSRTIGKHPNHRSASKSLCARQRSWRFSARGFQGREGRCQETGFLEFYRVVPYAAGGVTSAESLELRCRAHNALEAEPSPRVPYRRTPLARAASTRHADVLLRSGRTPTSHAWCQ